MKLQPPRLPASHVRRPALEQLLEEAERRRLTSIVAGPGFGKSTLAASVALERGWAWYLVDGGDRSLPAFARGLADALAVEAESSEGGGGRAHADALAAMLTAALEEKLDVDAVLVVDDVHELGRRTAAAFLLESLVRQAPPELHLVVSSREDPPFAVGRLRGQGQVLDVDASMLSFSGEEVVGIVGPELGAPIHALTAGWPAAVQLAAEMLQSVPEEERAGALAGMNRRSGPLVSYLAEEVVSREPQEVRELLRIGAEFDRFSVELCDAIGVSQPADVLAGLSRRGLISVRSGPEGWLSMHAVLRDFVREKLPLDLAALRDLHLRAARWFASRGLLREALTSFKTAGDPKRLADFLGKHWRSLIDRGFADAVVDSAELLPAELDEENLRHLVGRCYALLGRTGEALDLFKALPPGPYRAFEISEVLMQRNETAEAFDILVEATEGVADDPSYEYNWTFIAFMAASVGELDVGERAAQRALELAKAGGDLAHLADAHSATADVAEARGDGERAERHFRAANDLAARSGNLLALCAAQTKLGRLWALQGRYEDAFALVEKAIERADQLGFALMRSEGRHVRASLYARTGRFDEAAAELAAAAALDEAAARTAWDFVAHGDLYLERGDVALGRVAYQDALQANDPREVRQRSIALAGLARMLASDDPNKAAELAAEAVDSSVNERPETLLAAGWIALRRGELDSADAFAAEAEEEARRRNSRALLAETIELRAFCSGEPDSAVLEEALAIRRDLGEPAGAARVELALARIAGNGLAAERAERELQRLGFRDTAGRAAGVLMAAGPVRRAALEVVTLGAFSVLREGTSVRIEEWKSKKARDLLKLLASRRGKPVARDELIEALWPEEDPSRTGNRLSVALSTLRSVLDPGRAQPPDHFVAATDGAVRLSLETAEVDLEAFLAEAAQGLRLWRDGRRDEARPLLEAAEGAYTGDFLEEDRYEDWAEATRDEARAVYVDILRALAETGETRYFLRIVERDRYDEQAHLGLVATLARAGSHGEARRAYRTYLSRMEEIGAEPASFPEPTALSPA